MACIYCASTSEIESGEPCCSLVREAARKHKTQMHLELLFREMHKISPQGARKARLAWEENPDASPHEIGERIALEELEKLAASG